MENTVVQPDRRSSKKYVGDICLIEQDVMRIEQGKCYMLEKCLGVISFEDIGNEFGTLCKGGPVYMLPFAGRYKLVDFTLSNMINHGLSTIAVFTGENIQSVLNHLGDGKPWGLNRKTSGLSIFPPLFDYKKAIWGCISILHSRGFFINSKARICAYR